MTTELPKYQYALLLEDIAKTFHAQFVLVSLLEGERLTFPYYWGELPQEVDAFIKQETISVSDYTLAAMLVETGSAYYSEKPYAKEVKTPLTTLELMVAVEPLKTATGEIQGFINLAREAVFNTWTKPERELLRRQAAEFASWLAQSRAHVSEKRLKGLLQVSSSLAKTLTPKDVYETVLTESRRVLETRAGAVTVLRPDDTLEIIAAQGQPKPVIEAQRVLPLSDPHPLADTVRTGQALYFPDIKTRNEQYTHLRHLFSSATQSSAYLPMRSEERVIGVLTLSFPETHTFDKDEREFMNALAEVCARALERAQIYEREHTAKENYQTLFNSIDEGFCIFEMLRDEQGQWSDYRFLGVNPKFEEHTGLTNAVGKTAKELVPGLEQHWIDTYGNIAATGKSLRFEQGSEAMGRFFEVYGVRVGSEGSSEGNSNENSNKVALIFKDISERKRFEEQLKHTNTRFQLAEEAAGSFSYEWDWASDEITRSPNLKRVLGYDEHDLENTWEAWEQLLHPDDPQLSDKAKAKVFLEQYPDNRYSNAYRARHKDGHFLWLLEHGIIMRSDEGQVLRVIGQTVDITERKLSELNLAFLTALQKEVALLSSVHDIMKTVGAHIANRLGLAHCLFVEIDTHAEQATVLYDHHAPQVPDLKGVYHLHDFHTPDEQEQLKRGEAVVIHDVREAPRSDEAAAGFESLTIRSLMTAPYVSDGRWTFALSAQHDQPHTWHESEQALLTDITLWLYPRLERVRAEEELKEADKRKDEFLATLAHELRNPLAPIRTGLEIMKRSEDKTLHQEARNIIERQTDQIVRLVDDLLDVSRITRGTIKLHKEALTLAEVLDLATETAKPLMAEKNHQLSLELPSKDIWLMGDKTRLSQVFLNLLTNAAKYSPPASKVSVRAERQESEVVVQVEDTGIGLASEDLSKVFDLFARVQSGEASKQEGLGIGLHLVKRLVEMHGGSISVSSPGLHQGSTFSVRLPVLQNEPKPTQTAEVEKKMSTSRRILVVDDYEANRKTLIRMLSLMGHEVIGACSGAEALGCLQTVDIDLVLLDINMPGMNGYEVARRIQEIPSYRSIKLVALTGYGSEDDLRKAKEAGFHHHLVKPVALDVLEGLLHDL